MATYKFLSAVEKQTAEHLPFVFTVVGVPNLTALSMRGYFSEDDITMIALITKSKKVSGKRSLEEKVVNRLVEQKSEAFTQAYDRIRSAEWYIISARKADDLFRKLFIDRVYAQESPHFENGVISRRFGLHAGRKEGPKGPILRVARSLFHRQFGAPNSRFSRISSYESGRSEAPTSSCILSLEKMRG